MPTVVVIPQEVLTSFTRPGLDLLTGKVVELLPDPAPVPVQLELDLE